MKIKHIIIGFCAIAFCSSCNDGLDYNEIASYNKEDVFQSFTRSGNFVTNIYGYLDYDFGNYGNGAMLASASDESEFAWSISSIHDFYNGSWSKINNLSNTWTNSYSAIRAANFFLKESQGQTFEEFKNNKDYYEQLQKFNRYQYEVRLLRAYFYFNLVREYGDVPLVTTVLTADEANAMVRTPATQVIDFIVSECNDLVSNLPRSYSALAFPETGRVTRATALALKARTLLYAASPLLNPSQESAKWDAAAQANKAVLDSCAAYGITLGKYSDLWGTNNYKGSEIIFVRQIGELNSLEKYNFPVGVEGGASGNCPTQTLVDAYEMKPTGLSWDATGSGYNPTKPYDNRDPRFALTVVKNGDTGWPSYNSKPIEIFEGGANAAPISGATPSGHYLKKYCDASVNLQPTSINTKRHSWITFRLGEFYLNYAEAVFHVLGSPDAKNTTYAMSATEAVNKIRQRSDVGMPVFPVGLNNTDFDKRYRNERMVELAFEGHRFWDIRRWKMGNVLKTVTLMKITKDSGTGSLVYTRVIKNRQWDDKMYFFPIPDSEIRKNAKLTQNPGWN